MTTVYDTTTRHEHDNGVVTYQSDRLNAIGVRHAFATRIGGISKGPYASLNLGPMTKDLAPDDNTSVAENFRRLRAAVNLHQIKRVTVRQVHGCGAWTPPVKPLRPGEAPEADAIVTDDPTQMPTIRTADCVPLLFSSADGRVVAAVHAGWRGVVAEIVPRTIEHMAERYGVDVGGILAAVGPCIGVERFEVGEEVAEAFDGVRLGETVRRDLGDKPHVDLVAGVTTQLEAAGIAPDRIEVTDRCTYRDADEFFSHRRDNGVTGRMAAVICPCNR
ncbi:MAG: peptidoglycan editing factor PgeF [Phycisphaera sp.]|nr:peptidoglycan editing factor PgeF [Phycisphaera sp.]